MLRKLIRFGFVAAIALLIGACAALVDAPTGTITFAFPSGALSRGIGEETYNVAIYYGLDRYDAPPAISGDELTFSQIPTGDVRIIVARGRFDDDGFFYADEYGQLFTTIVAGDNGPYDLDLEESEFVWEESLRGSDVNGLAAIDSTGEFYASTVDSLMEGTFDGSSFSVIDTPTVPPGVVIDSLSVGKAYNGSTWDDQVWANGSWTDADGGGIMPWVGGALDLNFASAFGNTDPDLGIRKDNIAADLTVLYSGAFEVPDDADNGIAIMFQRDGGMGGYYLTETEYSAYLSDPSTAQNWSWIVDDINFDELLADVVDDSTEFIKGIVVSSESSAGYLVTSIATVKVSKDIISGDTAFDSPEDLLSSDSVAYAPDVGAPIVSIDVAGSDSGEVIYLGSANGLYAGSATESSQEFFAGSPNRVEGTSGYYIKIVSASPNNRMVAFAARRGANPELLIIVDTGSDKVVDFRGLQGLPGERLHNLVWLDNETLAVSGDHGLAVIDAAAQF